MTGDDYLATGFRDVDGAGASAAYIDCLRLLDSLPFYQQVKQDSYALMDLGNGQRVLDAGCGLGDDVFRMASRVGPGGQVIGLDSSTALIEKARQDPRSARLPVAFCAADLRTLPFRDGAFARCRIDRVLQHVPEPHTAIVELVRALEPGGILVAYDNDWSTFTVTADGQALTSQIESYWCNSFANSWIGRQLPEFFDDAGLSRIVSHPSISVITELETANKVYNLRMTVDRMAAAGDITDRAARTWIAGLKEKERRGCFAAELTAYTVVGHKDA